MFNPVQFYEYGKKRKGIILHVDAGDVLSYPGSGSTWNDLSGNDSHLSLYNSPVFSSSDGGYFLFNGINQYASVLRYKEENDYTINLWCNTVVTKTGGSWISSGTTSMTNFFQNGGGRVYQFMSAFSNSNIIVENSWVMLTGIKKGNNEKLYLNGTLIADYTNSSALGDILGKTIVIGKRYDNVYLNCKISYVKLWNYAITSTDITAEFNAIKSRYGL